MAMALPNGLTGGPRAHAGGVHLPARARVASRRRGAEAQTWRPPPPEPPSTTWAPPSRTWALPSRLSGLPQRRRSSPQDASAPRNRAKNPQKLSHRRSAPRPDAANRSFRSTNPKLFRGCRSSGAVEGSFAPAGGGFRAAASVDRGTRSQSPRRGAPSRRPWVPFSNTHFVAHRERGAIAGGLGTPNRRLDLPGRRSFRQRLPDVACDGEATGHVTARGVACARPAPRLDRDRAPTLGRAAHAAGGAQPIA